MVYSSWDITFFSSRCSFGSSLNNDYSKAAYAFIFVLVYFEFLLQYGGIYCVTSIEDIIPLVLNNVSH